MFLYNSIGYLDEEQSAYVNSILILVGSLIYIIIATLLTGYFFNLYNNKHHPFAGILDFSEGTYLHI